MNRILTILVVALLATPVFAECPNWNFIHGSYLNADVDVSGFDVGGDDTSIELQGWYTFGNALAVGAGVEFGDDATILEIGLRRYFMP
jgi:hypothetical protein